MPKSKKFPRWIWLVIAIIIIGGILIWVMKNRSVPNMDELGRDNLYHYRNEELGFSLDLPPEFIYYQVERFNAADYTEIRFFVRTSDPNYVYEVVPSYAKPIVIRVYSEAAWNQLEDDDEGKQAFEKKMTKNGRVYVIQFWDHQPSDWQDKWSDDMKSAISESLR